jgi:hypothetical protein
MEKATVRELPETPEAMVGAAWELLRAGRKQRKHGFHTPTLCTVDLGLPRARSVILRVADEVNRQLACHADARAAKVRQVRDAGVAAWHFYDREGQAQVVASGPTVAHTDDEVADARWRALPSGCHRTYARTHPPGTAVDEPWRDVPVAGDERANFAVIRTTVTALDVLLLHHAGHRRVVWRDGVARWVTP